MIDFQTTECETAPERPSSRCVSGLAAQQRVG